MVVSRTESDLARLMSAPRAERLAVGPFNKRYVTPEQFTDWPDDRIRSRVACGVGRAREAVRVKRHFEEAGVEVTLDKCLAEVRVALPWIGADNPDGDANQKGEKN
jgi:hypothetical protein